MPDGDIQLDEAQVVRRPRPGRLSQPVVTAGPSYAFRRFTVAFSFPSSSSDPMFQPGIGAVFDSYFTENDVEGFRSFLERQKRNVDETDECGLTPLMRACSEGKLGFVQLLIEHGADVNATDLDKWTPLLYAVQQNAIDVVTELLNQNALVDCVENSGWTPLLWACYCGHQEIATALVEQGADVHFLGPFHGSGILWAAGRGHAEIVQLLLSKHVNPNLGDKFGSTPLLWACRKGYTAIAAALLEHDINVDVAGINSWFPLMLAAQGGHAEIVDMLLEHRANVNAADKDGCTPLMYACKEGSLEVVNALLNHGAYVNVQDRKGDSVLIYAAKMGNRTIVKALIKKFADVNLSGNDKKTALYWAVEKGHVGVVETLLSSNPNLELANKDGDTPLLRAVRNRNAELVEMLIEKKARVTATDKKGDTVLHIAMRSRLKTIVEIILRNPKYSRLLYQPNKTGETPYAIDMRHDKTIQGNLLGTRHVNASAESEDLLGYDLYSSALANMLSEPQLNTPITVGLYAKWGSGKSFLLNKLRDEMKHFSQQWRCEPSFKFSPLLFVIICHVSLLFGLTCGLAVPSQKLLVGLGTGSGVLAISCFLSFTLWLQTKKYQEGWPAVVGAKIAKWLKSLQIVLSVAFCHPPGLEQYLSLEDTTIQPVRFIFGANTKLTSGASGSSVIHMIASLYHAIEIQYGTVGTRFFRAFKPSPVHSSSPWRFRKLCCVPYFLIVEFTLLCILALIALLVVLTAYPPSESSDSTEWWLVMDKGGDEKVITLAAIVLGVVIAVILTANITTWSHLFLALLVPPRNHLRKAFHMMGTGSSEGYIQSMKKEVQLMAQTVQGMDAFMKQKSRLVIIIDGLDSCDPEEVMHVLDAIHVLFMEDYMPFIIMFSIDPHIVVKAVEASINKAYQDTAINGYDYLNNLVHLPFYLQNSGLRKVKVAQTTAGLHFARRVWVESEEPLEIPGGSRSLRSESMLSVRHRSLRPRMKLRSNESLASSVTSNVHNRAAMPDFTKVLLTDDYFADISPRRVKRLLNILYITGRLLKAFKIEFQWYHLAIWVNILEQWPYRSSWIIVYHEQYSDALEDTTPLRNVYDLALPYIPQSKEKEPLLEIDRDEKKFSILLTLHKNSLQVLHLKMFLPFTINLDPYLQKIIKEEWPINESGVTSGNAPAPFEPGVQSMFPSLAINVPMQYSQQQNLPDAKNVFQNSAQLHILQNPPYNFVSNPWLFYGGVNAGSAWDPYAMSGITTSVDASSLLEANVPLRSLDAPGVCQLLEHIPSLSQTRLPEYKASLKSNNINGSVLLSCNLDDLKQVMGMSFGDWEQWKEIILQLRSRERKLLQGQSTGTNVDGHAEDFPRQKKRAEATQYLSSRATSRQQTLEKQVTMEDQMIQGVLSSVSEMASMDSRRESFSIYTPFSCIPSDVEEDSSEVNSRADGETDVLYLKTSSLGGATGLSQGSLLHAEGTLPCTNNTSTTQSESSPRMNLTPCNSVCTPVQLSPRPHKFSFKRMNWRKDTPLERPRNATASSLPGTPRPRRSSLQNNIAELIHSGILEKRAQIKRKALTRSYTFQEKDDPPDLSLKTLTDPGEKTEYENIPLLDSMCPPQW
ncbi:unnamed protein product [Darwinula stevensoni]|uniref:KAP NTPase domain-containing protein n=1 Tax=Darwinula stevensoni TaxID=69355 RepID=A0A7R8X2C4_9CRUS|nr:unnamed protein product [Darwinula stevensoni]CAG0881069.1 unnamed protein product [Darwinula stevensoni]